MLTITSRFATMAVALLTASPATAAEKVDFAREVQPILSNACYKCHGPAVQKAKLRLDQRDPALKMQAIVPGKPTESTLLERVTLEKDADGRMPPLEAGHSLTPAQIATLKTWIEQGAEYAPHWAFVKPTQPNAPEIRNHAILIGNAIDEFIVDRVLKAKLLPSPSAEPSTLLRRVYLDLTGLLPSPAEVDAFVKDPSPEAYARVVDTLLTSQHYGERQARHWLDLARYADSNGYTIDGPRQIWAFRDWVINALNADMPFDQFTIEQLAGDLLPNATKDQTIATGFHRNTSFNEEGGTDPEQFRTERTVDRTNTTGAVWLGLTIGCAQCHDHKYDPVSTKEYYQLYAYFNSAEEPTLPLGGDLALEKRIAGIEKKLAELRAMPGTDDEVKKTLVELKRTQGKVPSTLVMREKKGGRPTHVQIRGEFLRKGDEVSPGTPAVLSNKPKGPTAATGGSRLDLAKWLVSLENPTTARVTVNREWQKFFGRGLVETENDFGMQGSLPTHPELLDWLAVAFMNEDAWSFKKLHKRIVLSSTYRQASTMRKDLLAKDPRNLLLARQNRIRLEAEILRDAALSASGKLSPKVGGPGMYPPMPPEVFAFTQNKREWPESKGDDRYRRGMYTYIWRQAQHPLLTTFDAADAQVACTRRNRSNTPLQALHLANDPVFLELADELGKRIAKEGPKDDAGRIAYAFKLCYARTPSDAERSRVKEYLEALKRSDEKTAWTAISRVLMNLDEFVTRE